MNTKASYPNRINTIDDEQRYAIKRIHSMAEGHLKDKFIDPNKCNVINKVYDLCVEYFKNEKK